MTCGQCKRDNAPNRRYCGGCGHDLIVPCGVCGFPNARDDRYCGGCRLDVADGVMTRSQRMPVIAAGTLPVPDELAGLFGVTINNTPVSKPLPDANIGQDDLDRLFGGDR